MVVPLVVNSSLRRFCTTSAMLGRQRLVLSSPYGFVSVAKNQELATQLSMLQLRYVARFFTAYPPHQVMGLPSLSPTMESGSIASWNIAVGDTFGPGDSLCSIETDKATVDFEAQDEGVVAKILVPAGDGGDIPVGTPIMIAVEDTADVAAFNDYTSETRDPPSTEAAAVVATPPPTSAALSKSVSVGSGFSGSGKIFASPLARMLAQEMGYDLNSIPGTGPGGRIIAADVKEFTPSETTLTTSETASSPISMSTSRSLPIPGAGHTDYPLNLSAQDVAARLMQSKRNVPHYYLTVDVSVDKLLDLRKTLNDTLDIDSKPLGVYEFLLKAAALSMKTIPSANAAWMGSVVRVYDSVDINVVMGSGDTLSQPVIRNCGTKGLRTIANVLKAATFLQDDDSDQRLTDEIDTGLGTFTVVNLGMYGVKSCSPIIREPQACALSIGALENRIVPNDNADQDKMYKESVMFTATLSCDHRVVDGAVGAQWLAAFKSHVENPSTLLL